MLKIISIIILVCAAVLLFLIIQRYQITKGYIKREENTKIKEGVDKIYGIETNEFYTKKRKNNNLELRFSIFLLLVIACSVIPIFHLNSQ